MFNLGKYFFFNSNFWLTITKTVINISTNCFHSSRLPVVSNVFFIVFWFILKSRIHSSHKCEGKARIENDASLSVRRDQISIRRSQKLKCSIFTIASVKLDWIEYWIIFLCLAVCLHNSDEFLSVRCKNFKRYKNVKYFLCIKRYSVQKDLRF